MQTEARIWKARFLIGVLVPFFSFIPIQRTSFFVHFFFHFLQEPPTQSLPAPKTTISGTQILRLNGETQGNRAACQTEMLLMIVGYYSDTNMRFCL